MHADCRVAVAEREKKVINCFPFNNPTRLLLFVILKLALTDTNPDSIYIPPSFSFRYLESRARAVAAKKMPEIQLGMHTIRSHGTRVARTHMHDWLILLLLVIIDAVLNLIQPFHRFVGEGMMTDLRYPLKANTIPFWAVPIIAILLPLAVFLVYYFIRKDVYDLHHAIMGLLFSVLITAVMTDAIKDAVGRPRPDFFWRCFPDGKGVFDPVTSNVLCTGDKGVIKEGHKSFPSGHTSWSFAGLVYLAWYLSGKLRAFDRRGHVAKLCLVFLPILVAAMIAVSRVDDYWHHWQDVFAGALIGMIIASFCYLQFFPPPYDVDGWGPHAYFQMLAESRNGAQPSTVNNEIHHVQSAELQAVSLYIPPQHDADTRGNSWDSSPMLGASQNVRTH
ncbi:Lipid phosphate phosphatase 2 [Glycine soja]